MRLWLVPGILALGLFAACEPSSKAAPAGFVSVAPVASVSSSVRPSAAPTTARPTQSATAITSSSPAAVPVVSTAPATTTRAAAATTAAATRAVTTAAAKAPTVVAAVEAKKYPNCAALNVDYPHGVGRTGAVDKTAKGTPGVTNFTRDDAVYAANTARDGDSDGVACEKK